MEKHKPQYNTSVGPSMYPTMKSGDAYILKEISSIDEICRGDVIVFPHPDEPINVVHRIIRIYPEGFQTRGDNNNRKDPYIVKKDDIIGVVGKVIRKNKRYTIHGGNAGLFIHRMAWARKYSRPYIVKPLKFLLNLLIRSKIFFIFGNFFSTSITKINRMGSEQFILSVNKKPVGKKESKESAWIISFPYSLFINPKKLP